MKNNLRAIFSALFGIAVFLFWLLGYPEALNYQEQNQLFLTTTDYFILRMAVPGGLADYVSEFIVQFYYVPWLGALLIGIMYAVMQWIMWTIVRKWDMTAFPITFLLPLLMLWHQGDYKAAEKRLNILKNTIFYKSWAEEAETYLFNDAKVNSHETWGKLRRYRYKDCFLYSYPEKHKMLGLLFQQNTDNRLALSYFMGQLLLDGEFNSFMG